MSSSSTSNPLTAHSISEKLTKANHALWKAQVRAILRGARLDGHLSGEPAPPKEIAGTDDKKVANPAFEEWDVRDQQVLGFLLSSLGKDVLTHVVNAKTATEAWSSIEAMFASQSRARAVNLRIALSTTKKGNMTVTEYFLKMKGYGDDMAAAGRALDDEELVEHIITGLDQEYMPLVSALCARVEQISLDDLYDQLLSFEARMGLIYGGEQQHGSANMAGRGGRGSTRGRSNGRGRGGRGQGRGRGNDNNQRSNGGFSNNFSNKCSSNSSRPVCQVCYKKGHTAIECWYRFEEDYVPDEKLAAATSSSYGIDTNWYMDTGATDNVMGELEKLSVRDKYNGGDQIHTASGAGSGHKEHAA